MTRKSQHASVSNLVRLFRTSLDELGYEPPREAIEALSFLVFEAMTGRSREYHGVGHVFAVASGLPPLGRLAAIFHDTVYYHVDHGFIPEIWERIQDVCTVDNSTRVTLSRELDEEASDVAAIFGFAPGQPVDTTNGLNEFLSALLAVRLLGPVLKRKEAWTIAACIEATIPFRGRDSRGMLPSERLYERLAAHSAFKRVRCGRNELTEIVQLAVRLANSDVQSFAQVDVGDFLDDTWKLLPESYPELHNSGAYSIRSYCNALVKTEAFLASLDPQRIFQQHEGVPGDHVCELLRQRAHGNLSKGCEYLRAKIVTVSILQAFAELTGGDAPVSYFTGAAESGETMAHALLPEDEAVPTEGLPAIDPMVLHVLTHGRVRSTSFDTPRSPLAAHLYEHLGSAGIQAQTARARLARTGERDWRWYLDGIPRELLVEMAQAVAEIAVERRTQILKLASLKPGKIRKAA